MKTKHYLSFLVESGIVGREEVEKIINYRKLGRGEVLEDILLTLDIFTERQLANKLSNYLNLSVIFELKPFINWELLKDFELDYLKSNLIFPVLHSENTLYLATRNPLDTRKLYELEETFNLKVKPIISTKSEINRVISYIEERGRFKS